MSITVNVSGTWKTATPSARVGGAWKSVANAYVRVGGAWKEFYTAYTPPGLAASLSPGSLSASGYGTGPFTTSGSVTASASGGTLGYSYAWQFVSGDSSITPTSATAATTSFSASGSAETKNAVYRCQVTDAAASVVYTGNVSIAITFAPALAASISPSSLSGSGYGTGPFTTSGSATASASGGSGGYSYAWQFVSGDNTITPTSATSAATAFSATGSAQTKNASYRCQVTDSVGAVVHTGNVSIAITFAPALAASVSPGSLSASGYGSGPYTTGSATASASGGSGGYTYAWQLVSGDASVSPNSATSASTTFSASGTPTSTKNATYRCQVTDSASNVAYTGNVSVAVTFNAVLAASASTGSLSGSGYGTGPFTTSGSVTINPSGGAGGYSYAWEYVSGDATVSADTSTSQTTTFSATGSAQTKNAVYRGKVTDAVGATAYTGNVSIALTFNPALSVGQDTTSANAYDAQGGPPFFFSNITTNSVTAQPSGGSGGYSYLWEYVSGDTSFSCNSNTSATTTWTHTAPPTTPNTFNAVWRCRVTDSASNVAYSANIAVQAQYDTL